MDDETALRETLKMLNSDSGDHNPVGHWPDLRSEPFRRDRVSVSGPLPPQARGFTYPRQGQTHVIVIDKTMYRVRFEGETESQVRIIVEPNE